VKQKFNIKGVDFEINDFKAFVIISLLCFSVYGNIIFNNYSLNDTTVVTNNKFVKQGIAGIPDILSNPYQYVYSTTISAETDYRPLAEITLAIEYQFFGLNPHVSHLINILLYIILSFLLYELLLCFNLNQPIPYLPLLITCFFIVHTAHTEVVASIKNREEILALLFGIASLIFVFRFYTSDKQKWGNLLGIISCLLLSFLSKISAAPIIGIMVLMAYQFGQPVPLRKKLLFILPAAFGVSCLLRIIGVPATLPLISFPILIAYAYRDRRDVWFNILLITLLVITLQSYLFLQDSFGSREAASAENPLVNNHDLAANLAFALDSLWFYFRFMFFPFPSRFYYGTGSITLHQLTDAVPVASFLVHSALLIYGLYKFWNRELIGLIILGYFVCIFPYMNLFHKYTGIVSERALFLPGVWFIIGAFILLFDFLNGALIKTARVNVRRYIWLLLVGLFFVYSGLTINRNFQWNNYISLYTADIDKLKNSIVPNLMYADILRSTGEFEKNAELKRVYFDKSISYYRHVIRLAPKSTFAYFGLGKLYRYDLSNPDSGCNYFYSAYLTDTTQTMPQFQVARCAFEHGENVKAKLLLADLFNKVPEDTFVLFYYARTLYLTGDALSASRVNEILAKRDISPMYYYVNEAYFAGAAGNMPRSAENFEKAMALGYRDDMVFNLLLNYYLNTNQSAKANSLQRFSGRSN